jgi:adenylate kinase
LDRKIAKDRITGRRLCVNDNNHPNNINIDAIKPVGGKCRVCGGDIKKRPDDQDEEAIDKRHDIYYDSESGTMAALNFYKDLSQKKGGIPRIIELDGRPGVKDVSKELLAKLI